MGKPVMWVEEGLSRPSLFIEVLRTNPHVKTLMIAGNRESKMPGIGARRAIPL